METGPKDDLRGSYGGIQSAFDGFVAAFGQQLKDLGQQVQNAELTIEGLNGEIEERDKRITELEALLKAAKEATNAKTDECKKLANEKADLNAKIQEQTENMKKLQGELKEMTEKNGMNEQRLADLRKSLLKANQQNEQMSEKMKSQTESIAHLTKVKEAYKALNAQLDRLCHKFDPEFNPEKEGEKRIEALSNLISGVKAELMDVYDIYNSFSSKLGQVKQDNVRWLERLGSKKANELTADEKDAVAQTSKTLRTQPIKRITEGTKHVKKAFTNSLTDLLIEVNILEKENQELSEYKRINELLKKINQQKLQEMIDDFKRNDEERGELTEKEVKTMARKNTSLITNVISLDSDLETVIGVFKEMAMANTKHILQIKKLEDKLREYGHEEDCDMPVELTETEAVSMYGSYLEHSGILSSAVGMSGLDPKVE